MITLTLSEQLHQSLGKDRGVPQREIRPLCARDLRFGAQRHHHITLRNPT